MVGNLLKAVFFFGAGFVMTGCASAPCEEVIVDGENPAISRDGRRLAFQRIENGRCHLGVMDLSSRRITWIARGEMESTRNENACHPSWGPEGTLAYSYANITNTAYQRFKGKSPPSGYALRIWKDGVSREMLGGLSRNYSPSFTPDGRRIYFCRQGGLGDGGRYDFGRREAIAWIESDSARPDPMPAVRRPSQDAGLSQPVVSPDGRWLAYAELSWAYGIWGIKVGRLEDPVVQASVSPGEQSAYAPNWFPDSRHLVYTGFFKGDPGWCVYVLDVVSGAFKRLCEGEDACVSPDGASVFYSRGGKIFRRTVGSEDMPVGKGALPDPGIQREEVLFRYGEATTNRVFRKVKAPHDCGPGTVHFYRYKFCWDGGKTAFLFSGGFGDAGSARSFMIDNASTMAGHCTIGGASFIAGLGTELNQGVHEITAIIADGVLYNSADGCAAIPRRGKTPCGGCDGDWQMTIFPNGNKNPRLKVLSVEMGIGWPANVPRPLRFE